MLDLNPFTIKNSGEKKWILSLLKFKSSMIILSSIISGLSFAKLLVIFSLSKKNFIKFLISSLFPLKKETVLLETFSRFILSISLYWSCFFLNSSFEKISLLNIDLEVFSIKVIIAFFSYKYEYTQVFNFIIKFGSLIWKIKYKYVSYNSSDSFIFRSVLNKSLFSASKV